MLAMTMGIFLRLTLVLQGSDVVIHLASYGMSGASQLNTKRVEQVNVIGTENVCGHLHTDD